MFSSRVCLATNLSHGPHALLMEGIACWQSMIGNTHLHREQNTSIVMIKIHHHAVTGCHSIISKLPDKSQMPQCLRIWVRHQAKDLAPFQILKGVLSINSITGYHQPLTSPLLPPSSHLAQPTHCKAVHVIRIGLKSWHKKCYQS